MSQGLGLTLSGVLTGGFRFASMLMRDLLMVPSGVTEGEADSLWFSMMSLV